MTRQEIVDSSKLKKFADDNFKLEEKWKKVIQTGRKHCGKRRNARYEHFLLFPQCFQKACFSGASKGIILWEWVNPLTYETHFFFWNIGHLKTILVMEK